MEALREAAARPPVQIDVKFIEPTSSTAGRPQRKHYQFTAIDDCTRLRVLRIYPRGRPEDRDPLPRLRAGTLPFRVERIQTDNGAEFQSAFHWHVLDQGISHTYIKPATPRLNGKVERSHRIDAEEFYRMLDGVMIDDTGVFNDKLREWEDYYVENIRSGSYQETSAPLELWAAAIRRFAQHARDSGDRCRVPLFTSALFEKAMAAGYGREEVSAVFKVLEQPADHQAHGVQP